MSEQNPSPVIEICLRYLDGNPVVGESVLIEHQGHVPYYTQESLTNEAGSCAWSVYPGLYELCVRDFTIRGTLPILALRGNGLAIPGMVARVEKTTYHLVLDGDHLAFDATPLAPRPTPVRCEKRQTYELMIPSHEPVPSLGQTLPTVEGMATTPVSTEIKGAGPVVYNPFMRVSTDWVLQPRSTHDLGPRGGRAPRPTFYYKSMSQQAETRP